MQIGGNSSHVVGGEVLFKIAVLERNLAKRRLKIHKYMRTAHCSSRVRSRAHKADQTKRTTTT